MGSLRSVRRIYHDGRGVGLTFYGVDSVTSAQRGRAGLACLLAVPSGDDVGLNLVLGSIRRVARDDASLIERTNAQIGAAAWFAAVSAASEDDRALFPHRAIT